MTENKEKPIIGLKEIHIKNFRGIKDASIEGIPQGTQWIFLTGENGYGKTCLLQAMFTGLQNGNFNGQLIFTEGKFEVKTNGLLNEKINIVSSKSDKNKEVQQRISFPDQILGYGPSRLSIQDSQVDTESALRRTSPGYGLFRQDGIFKNIEYYLKIWYLNSQVKKEHKEYPDSFGAKFSMVKNAFLKLLPNLSDIKINRNSDEGQVEYYELDALGKKIPESRGLNVLAAGNKSIIALVGDMIINFLVDGLKRETMLMGPPLRPKKLSEINGIVIIDELDLHLHPSWQKRLPGILSEIFPKVQFIVSTHSPIPFLGAPEGSVFLKVDKSAKEGITVKKVEVDIKNLTPNLILSSPIFGFTEIFPVTHKEEDRIRTEDTYEEMKESDELYNSLRSFLGTDKEKKLEKLLKPKK